MIKVVVLCIIRPCILVGDYRMIRGHCCHHLYLPSDG